MKKTKLLAGLLSTLCAVSILGCNLNSTSPNLINSDTTFSIMGLENEEYNYNYLQNQKNYKNQFNRHHGILFEILGPIKFTQEQKVKIKDIMNNFKPLFRVESRQNFYKHREILKEAFLSDKINKEQLTDKLYSLKPNLTDDEIKEHCNKQAQILVKIYQILTEEQKKEVKENVNKIFNKPNLPKFNNQLGFITKFPMFKELNLTDTQKEKINNLFKDIEPPKVDIEKVKNFKLAVISELEKNNPDVNKIETLLYENRPKFKEFNIENMINKLIKLHEILTKEQREILVKNFENFGNRQFKNKQR